MYICKYFLQQNSIIINIFVHYSLIYQVIYFVHWKCIEIHVLIMWNPTHFFNIEKSLRFALKSRSKLHISTTLLRFSVVYILKKYRFLKAPWIALMTWDAWKAFTNYGNPSFMFSQWTFSCKAVDKSTCF